MNTPDSMKSGLWLVIDTGTAGLHPACFALVMATGIVSIACHHLGMDFLAFPLFYLNQFCHAVLWLLFLMRLLCRSSRVFADLPNHNLGVGFFTLVPGTNVLGNQFLSSNQQAAFRMRERRKYLPCVDGQPSTNFEDQRGVKPSAYL